jgi:hypothetical protein
MPKYTSASLERALVHFGVAFRKIDDRYGHPRPWVLTTAVGVQPSMTHAEVYAYVLGQGDAQRRLDDDRRVPTDTAAVDAIASLLNVPEDWSSETLDQVAVIILTVRQEEEHDDGMFRVKLGPILVPPARADADELDELRLLAAQLRLAGERDCDDAEIMAAHALAAAVECLVERLAVKP